MSTHIPNDELRRGSAGFTLIELVVTLIILAILAAAAAPSFIQSRQRAIARGAAESIAASIAQARMEAAKRNDFVTVSIRGADGNWCIGIEQGAAGCDCLTKQCGIQTVQPAAFRGARLLAAPNFNGDPDLVIDPRLGVLRNPADAGAVVVRSASDAWDYQVRVNVGLTAQTSFCSPAGALSVGDMGGC